MPCYKSINVENKARKIYGKQVEAEQELNLFPTFKYNNFSYGIKYLYWAEFLITEVDWNKTWTKNKNRFT